MKNRIKVQQKTNSLEHRECTREAKIYPKLHKSWKSKIEGMARPFQAVLHSNKDRRKICFISMIKHSSPSKILLFCSLYTPHNTMRNNIPNRCCSISPNTSMPASKQLNYLFRHNPRDTKQAKLKRPPVRGKRKNEWGGGPPITNHFLRVTFYLMVYIAQLCIIIIIFQINCLGL